MTYLLPAGGATDIASHDTPRRAFLRHTSRASVASAVLAIGACGGEDSPLANTPAPTSSGSPSPTPTSTPTLTPVNDADMLAMMLQFHYLQAQFYAGAVLGTPMPTALLAGTGTQGSVTGPRPVIFTDPVLADLMREIAVEKIDQVIRLRAVLGPATPASPALNLGVDDAGAFTKYGRDSNVVPTATGGAARGTYDVYADQQQFLLGAFLLEDPVVTGWRGAAGLMTDNASIDVAAGLMATSAFHSGVVRSQLFAQGIVAGSTLASTVTRLSQLRATYSPEGNDQGVGSGPGAVLTANITAADADGELFGRLPQFMLNVFYMTTAGATSGGFFPVGLNGALRASVQR